jgi:transcriptional regulator with XRE-family HTH domain
MDIKKQFGNRVKKLRTERGLSQEGLAHLAELDRTYIPSIEKGERKRFYSCYRKNCKRLKSKNLNIIR